MTTDRYMKFILTVIAVALVTLAAQNFVRSSGAAGAPITKVATGWLNGICAGVLDIATARLWIA